MTMDNNNMDSGNHSAKIGNDTIDVLLMGCFGNFDTTACVRNGLLSTIVLMTGCLCVAKLCKLYVNRHPTLHQYIIFYSATIECIICAVSWTLVSYFQLELIAQYLKLIQFLVVSHFYWTLATRALRKETLSKRLIAPASIGIFVYFSVIVGMACVDMRPSWIECFQPYWLMLSSAEVVLAQLFTVAGFYVTRRLNEISTMESVRRSQKRDLWSLIIIFQISAFVGLIYDLTLQTIGDEENGCSGVFLHMQELYTPVFGLFMVFKILLPIWIMLFVFHPLEMMPDSDDFQYIPNEEGTHTSVFSPAEHACNIYKPLFQPGSLDSYQSESYDSPYPSPADVATFDTVRTPPPGLAPIFEESGETIAEITDDRRPILQGYTG